jgi:hypothetical protein
MSLTRSTFVLILSLTAVLPALFAQQPMSVSEQYLFSAVNAERQQHGLQPVQWDPVLYRAATYHADAMAEHNTISHQFSGEPELSARGAAAGAHFSVISENVAMGSNAVQLHDMWMHSPHHRDNILDASVDHVAIRVVRHNGELYAVEDFERQVASLSLSQQEQTIANLVQNTADVTILPTTADVRRTCAMDSGYAGPHKPWFVMRFTGGQLNHLPDALVDKLSSGRYHSAAIGACPATDVQNFSAYNIAVLLYP